MENNKSKNIEEDWKNQLNFEIKHAKKNNKPIRKPTFSLFLSSISVQVMIAMGKIDNPINGKNQTNFDQARFLIGTLSIIRDKSKNNLNAEEKNLIDNYITNLKLVYLESKKSFNE